MTPEELHEFKRVHALTTSDLARLALVSQRTVWRWLRNGTSAHTDLALSALVRSMYK